jgi:uncharacterized protein with PQ loop repeat
LPSNQRFSSTGFIGHAAARPIKPSSLDDTIMPRSRVATINAAFLLLTLPFLLRLWFEAVVLRIDSGPQMLGFSLVHGGAGALTIPLMISWVATYIYWLFVIAVAALWLFPTVRARIVGTPHILLGGVGTLAVQALALYMQSDLPTFLLYAVAFLLSVIVMLLAVVAAASLRLSVAARVV